MRCVLRAAQALQCCDAAGLGRWRCPTIEYIDIVKLSNKRSGSSTSGGSSGRVNAFRAAAVAARTLPWGSGVVPSRVHAAASFLTHMKHPCLMPADQDAYLAIRSNLCC